ncbi:oxygen-insensitive NADPH nitroreductase [Exiguobacterium sp. SH0S2]|uniref:oxygen-insensitive NADPH nitroreductase n=1 Tax=Exiguobacterium sp. SH0S2 TaxID=2510950 RepID=UPI00103DFA8C|nr:oxygen-insensitive NADPH nitroreductase [Exiguobacterium sp. SH0S2]TCI65798.1 oxygen-insensitive NADPH nitroreductase [Exiguobacterium sp. SH0S2]
MNQIIETLLNHRSVRSFTDETLTDEQIRLIVESAQRASTSSFIQAYSIIGVTDPEKKARLAEIAGNQQYVVDNGHFFVFCADLYRHELIGQLQEAAVNPTLETDEKLLVAVIDAALASQNAVVAAESMGLGICYIGGIRNDMSAVKELLGLPERVLPLFGLAVGVPAHVEDQKPRLPLEHIYHENTYDADPIQLKQELTAYDQTIHDYYVARGSNQRSDTWTGQMGRMLSKPTRLDVKDFLKTQGYLKQ